MIYVFVLFGSFAVICAVLGGRVLLKHRVVRNFVRSIGSRTNSLEQRSSSSEETYINRPQRDPRTSAIKLQELKTFVRQAEKAIARKQYDEAERLYIQALTVNPQAHDVQADLARLYLTSGREGKAEAMYRELLRFTNDVSFHANLGFAYYRQGKFAEACEEYRSALNLDPKNPDRMAALGRACIAVQRFQEAIPLLENAVNRLPRDTKLLRLLAQCYAKAGSPEQEHAAYVRINKLEPYDEEVKQKITQLVAQQK